MTTQRKILKGLIIIILAIFLLSTWLVSVMYLANKNTTGTWSLETWVDLQSWTIVETGLDTTVDTWKVLPTLTKEEASKELQNMLSGVNTSGIVQ